MHRSAFLLFLGFTAWSQTVTRVARTPVEDWTLANPHLRVLVRSDNLTVSVEDLAARETWG